jgi:hypothetical protein
VLKKPFLPSRSEEPAVFPGRTEGVSKHVLSVLHRRSAEGVERTPGATSSVICGGARRQRRAAWARYVGIVAGILLVLAAGCYAGAAQESPTPGPTAPPFDLPEECRSRPRPPSEEVLAYRILMERSDALVLDSGEFAALSNEIESVLARIRAEFPEVPTMEARLRYVVGQIVVGFYREFVDALDVPEANHTPGPPITFGHGELDALSAALGFRALIGAHRFGDGPNAYLHICLDPLANIPAAAEAYEQIDVVTWAGGNSMIGDSPDIAAATEGGAWYFVFRDAFGDCPAGCIFQELYYFIADPEVRQVPEQVALRDPVLRRLAATWGEQRLPELQPLPVELPRTGGR